MRQRCDARVPAHASSPAAPAARPHGDHPHPACTRPLAHLPGGGERGADVRRAQLAEPGDQQQHALEALHAHAPPLRLLQAGRRAAAGEAALTWLARPLGNGRGVLPPSLLFCAWTQRAGSASSAAPAGGNPTSPTARQPAAAQQPSSPPAPWQPPPRRSAAWPAGAQTQPASPAARSQAALSRGPAWRRWPAPAAPAGCKQHGSFSSNEQGGRNAARAGERHRSAHHMQEAAPCKRQRLAQPQTCSTSRIVCRMDSALRCSGAPYSSLQGRGAPAGGVRRAQERRGRGGAGHLQAGQQRRPAGRSSSTQRTCAGWPAALAAGRARWP